MTNNIEQTNKVVQTANLWWTNNAAWVLAISILTPLAIMCFILLRNSTIAYNHSGINDYKAGHYAKSIEESKAYLKAHPDPGLPDQRFLGYAYLKTGQYENAEQAFRAHLRVVPGNSEVHYWLGIALFKQGKKLEAHREFETAIRVEGEGGARNYNKRLVDRAQAMIDEIDKSQ